MNDQEDEDRSIQHWFKDHVPVLEAFRDKGGHKIETLLFSNPKSSCYWVRYYHHLGFLHVVGDIGEAIHQWSYREPDSMDLSWIAHTDFGYFMGKLKASRHHDGKVWDEKRARAWFSEYISENKALELLNDLGMEDNPKTRTWATDVIMGRREATLEPTNAMKRWRETMYIAPTAKDAFGSREEWASFLKLDEAYSLFGEDYCEYAGVGLRYDVTHRGHWMGLKLAFDRLRRDQL